MFSSGCFEVGCYCAARVDLGLSIPVSQSPRGCGDRCLCSQLASPFYFVCFLLRKHLTVQPGWLELAVPSRTQVQTVSCIKITNSSLGLVSTRLPCQVLRGTAHIPGLGSL